MKFSVLIANYNNAVYLATALDSVISQSYNNWEIILVDDCSTDNVNEVLKGYRQYQNIRIFRNEKNMGCGYTKSLCATMATGEVAGFLDPDDALHPEALKTMVEAFKYKTSCSLIYSTHYICDKNLSVKRIADNTKALPLNTPYLLVSDGTIHHFAAFRLSAYKQTAGLDPQNTKAVDQDLYYKMEETGNTFFVDLPLYYYRVHTNGISNGGKESQALLIHYHIIEEACKRRISRLNENIPAAMEWIKIYTRRKIKIRIMRQLLEKKWLSAAVAIGEYALRGGQKDMVEYLKKIHLHGFKVFQQTLTQNNEIKL